MSICAEIINHFTIDEILGRFSEGTTIISDWAKCSRHKEGKGPPEISTDRY
jgi:hypothetical protein